jgi:putative ABC transport system permease protein
LRPVLGRLLGPQDDGPKAAGAAVLTYRFWSTSLKSDPSVIGKTLRLGSRTATIVGVLEPTIPYPADTELIANIVTSPHHLSATMVTGRVHRMSELFGRLAPGATVETARTELRDVYQRMVKEHPEAYSKQGQSQIHTVKLRDQVTAGASTVLWILLAASALIFVIACSNVANLILARSVRREGELAIRAALGASPSALRRVLLAESLLLSIAGAGMGVLIASPLVLVLARYAARFSVRALDLHVDASLLWVGTLLAIIATVLLAFVPRLPGSNTTQAISQSGSTPRVTGGANRRLRIFAITQIAASFVLLAGAAMLVKTLLSLQTVKTAFDTRHVLTVNVPPVEYGHTQDQLKNTYKEMLRRVRELPGVSGAALGIMVPWREGHSFGPGFEFSTEGYVRAPGEEYPRAQMRTISSGFFSSVGVPIVAGRDFNDSDRNNSEPVAIVSQTLARRMFPNGDAVNHHLTWTDPIMKFVDISTAPRRIVGVAADADDDDVVPGPTITVYHPFDQQPLWGGRLFVHTAMNPYSLVPQIESTIRQLSADQPVEKAATLEDVRAEVLTPERLNTLVFGIFAAVALIIAVVGVAGVLAFSVSGRIREFGIRLAIGSQLSDLVRSVIKEGLMMTVLGLLAGVVCGAALAILLGRSFEGIKMPGFVPVVGAMAVLMASALAASFLPAKRAARVDVMQALRAE